MCFESVGGRGAGEVKEWGYVATMRGGSWTPPPPPPSHGSLTDDTYLTHGRLIRFREFLEGKFVELEEALFSTDRGLFPAEAFTREAFFR